MTRPWAMTLALALLGLLTACPATRRPLPRHRDGGPAVEVVEGPGAGPAPLALPPSMPLLDEHEPDDDRDHAQPIELGKGIRGSVLPPTVGGAGKGDDDWYSYLIQGPDPALPQELKVQLVGGRGLHLLLDLYDGDGKRIAGAEGPGTGPPAELSGLLLKVGATVYLRVRARPPLPASPAEAEYRLLPTQVPAAPGSESEPNDTPEQATPIGGSDLSGVLSSKKDEDWFALPVAAPAQGAGGILRVELHMSGVVPLLRIAAAGAEPGRSLVVQVLGAGEDLRLRNVGVPAGAKTMLLGIGALSYRKAAAAERYHARVLFEPRLEGAEQEPNDDCQRPNVIGSEGIAGFLWPGDADCFELRPNNPDPNRGPATIRPRLTLPPGCEAELVPAEPLLKVRDRLLLQIRARGAAGGCFEAPYRLQVDVEPER